MGKLKAGVEELDTDEEEVENDGEEEEESEDEEEVMHNHTQCSPYNFTPIWYVCMVFFKGEVTYVADEDFEESDESDMEVITHHKTN